MAVRAVWSEVRSGMNKKKVEALVRERERKRRLRTAAYAVVVLGVLSSAFVLLRKDLFPGAPSPLAGNVIDVTADMGGFSTYEIRVPAGEAVTVRLTSLDNTHHTDGGGKHQWAVDELGVDIVAPALGSTYATFTPQAPGEYTFYCDICCGGRANPTMNGTLIVEGST